MANRDDITADYIRSILDYDPETGIFRWRVWRNYFKAQAGTVAGYAAPIGYLLISIKGTPQYGHRLAWLYVYGEWPSMNIDHINGDGYDNRIANLRLCDQTLNSANAKRRKNNTSGIKGVTWNKRRNKWTAQLSVRGRHIFLGDHATIEEAKAAYERGALSAFGAFARTD